MEGAEIQFSPPTAASVAHNAMQQELTSLWISCRQWVKYNATFPQLFYHLNNEELHTTALISHCQFFLGWKIVLHSHYCLLHTHRTERSHSAARKK